MKNIFKLLLALGLAALAASSCQPYDEMPPKTDKAVKYALPDPVYPDEAAIAALKAIRQEHEQHIQH